MSTASARVGKRCLRACERCRNMKVKCSGTQPCSRCGRRKKQCHYPIEDKRVSIPESYLHELENRSNRNSAIPSFVGLDMGFPDRPSPSSTGGDGAPSSDEGAPDLGNHLTGQASQHSATHPLNETHRTDDPESNAVSSKFRQNPLVDTDYTFLRARGKYWYMGPSSSWSFCRRVLALLGKRIPESCQNPDPWHLDGMAFKLQWQPLRRDEAPDVSNLPPLDYALYLFNTVKFYFGVLFYVIDEPNYLKELYELYEAPATKANLSRMWYAQYLLILAFGKAIVNNTRGRNAPPGYQYAVRAMSLMPDLSGLDVDAYQAIETLSLAALYLQSVDMRMAAFHHIGQALRTCILEGLHRHVPEEVVGTEMSKRCNVLFWVVYMLERDFSAQIGGPSTIRDEDITAKLPSHVHQGLEAWNMSLHVQISRLMAQILTTVYGVGKDFEESLIKNTQSILRNLAEISGSLTDLLNTHFQGSVNKASRIALRLVLAYHHCVVLTTRPLVMCALHVHIEHTQGGDRSSTISLAPPVSSLMQSCVDSAQTILRTLRVLGDEDLLEAFLPFQLEDAFSSAFLLQIIRTMSPSLIPDDSWKHNTEKVLDRMISQGSLVAPLRKLELSQLESMMVCMTPKDNQPLTPAPSNNDRALHIFNPNDLVPEHFMPEPGWDVFDDDGGMGLSPRVLLDLAEQLDVDFLAHSVGN